MIEFRSVGYAYPGAAGPALVDVSLVIPAGEFVLLAGPSGSGKSTLLRAINGLVPHLSGGRFAGSASVAGLDTRTSGPRELSRICGFVFQDPDAQSVAATVEEEIAFSLEQVGVPRATMRLRVEEMLDFFGLSALRRRMVTTLSGGERQRVAIAGAMVLHPSILVLDEPTSQLDPWGADDTVAALQRLNVDLGVTVIVAEHRLDRFLPVADRLIWLSGGRVMRNGPAQEVIPALPERFVPPIAQLARRLLIGPAPTTLKEAKSGLAGWTPANRTLRTDVQGARTVVDVQGLSIEHNGRALLRRVHLSARDASVVAIMGRNGAGKTTLLRSLFGFVKPVEGSVRVFGSDMRTTPAAELGRRAAYLPQRSGAVLFNESVRAELEFTARHRGSTVEPDGLVADLDIVHLLDRDPRDLSEGQRLRAALAAVLVGEPDLVVLDEPTRGLDGDNRAALIEVIASLRTRGACVIISTHDVELAAMFADRVVLLGSGEVIADDLPDRVLSGALAYSTQMNRLFGGGYLTVDDVLPRLEPVPDTVLLNAAGTTDESGSAQRGIA